MLRELHLTNQQQLKRGFGVKEEKTVELAVEVTTIQAGGQVTARAEGGGRLMGDFT